MDSTRHTLPIPDLLQLGLVILRTMILCGSEIRGRLVGIYTKQ